MEIGEDEIKFENLQKRHKKLINEARILLVRFFPCLFSNVVVLNGDS